MQIEVQEIKQEVMKTFTNASVSFKKKGDTFKSYIDGIYLFKCSISEKSISFFFPQEKEPNFQATTIKEVKEILEMFLNIYLEDYIIL